MKRAKPLRGTIALVTGASRGIGKGVALELGSLGATVYATGRTLAPDANPLGGTLGETVAELDALGGEGVAVRCDHADDAQVRAVFERIQRERGRLDLLVNNACSAQDMARHVGLLAWQQPLEAWDEVHRVGLRSAYVASVLAAPMMVAQRSGLIANISSMGAVSYLHSVAYGTAKAGLDKLAADLAYELARYDVTAVSLWPGLVRTELVLSQCRDNGRGGLEMVLPAHAGDTGPQQVIDLAISESPRFTGRAVAALYRDEKRQAKSGRAFACAELALEYGFTDDDGVQPPVIRNQHDAAKALPSLFNVQEGPR
jgi:NAD(P)-dependent dehydrogenase (short-subunit alcohol dehydrogenase family)